MEHRLAIVINTYNVKTLLLDCLGSIYKNKTKSDDWQVIVCDMASSDGTLESVKKTYPGVLAIASENIGFARGNNLAKKYVKAPYILFLNPDTLVNGFVIQNCLTTLQSSKELGAVGCRIMLSNGKLDYSCHRGLPTIWNSFSYLSGFSKIFPRSKFFSGYTATYLDYYQSHEIDCITGAFLMIKKPLLDEINWWDEDYFWNGEDVEMCYRIKKAGYKIWYEASETITHFKGSSSGLYSTSKTTVPKSHTIKLAKHATLAMRLFIQKHWKELGPAPIVVIAWLSIWLLEKYRLFKIHLGLKYA